MADKISRRDLLKTAAVAGVGRLVQPDYVLPAAPVQPPPSGPSAATAAAASERILPLASTDGVFVPPRGESFFKFSFDFPEPSVDFEGLQFSFRLYTFENTYALDREAMKVEANGDGLDLDCTQLVWAGGQQKSAGKVRAQLRRNGSFIEWSATAEMPQPIKSIAAIVRGVPRGKISAGGSGFYDPKDNEVLLGYPFGGGSLFTARGINTPLAVIQSGEGEYFFLSALHDQVRAHRFYFQPGEKGYRVELVFEAPGWQRNPKIETPAWRAGRTSGADAAFSPHFEHLERAFGIPAWADRQDVPAWFRSVKLVVSLHGMHWTGYIFNSYARQLEILRWVASQIPPAQVLVFLPAWDGRYYWNYPLYEVDSRMGGEAGYRQLIEQGHALGFHFMPMFGTNAANRLQPMFPKIADATVAQIDGDAFNLNWVDWDNDRHFEGWQPYMNLGVDSWREWLSGRIAAMIEHYRVESYFLDIAGGWENNTKADTHEGTRKLVSDLRRKYPGVLCCGEMPYDALMAFIPLYHVFSEHAYPAAFQKYCRAFQHLSHPAPGRGSSGVHESGFSRFDPATLSLSPYQIPTITVVDDTFDRHRDVMAQIIARAKSQRAREY
ncbi:MAG TPA: hypothetical protein VGZ29_07765 [Terriglobia bacterium]|nr:hypothetical protein [Terriglobia bacterium]